MEPNQRDLGKEKKTWPQKAPMFGFHLRFLESLPSSSDIVWGVATCKPLLCFAMFSFIPLAYWRWWVWHVMTPCILLVQWFQAILGKNSIDPHLGNKLMGCQRESKLRLHHLEFLALRRNNSLPLNVASKKPFECLTQSAWEDPIYPSPLSMSNFFHGRIG